MSDRCQHGFLRGKGLCPTCKTEEPVDRLRPPAARTKQRVPHSHPGFQDLTGQVLAGCTVLSRAPNLNGTARWNVRAACGHEIVLPGIVLRAADKRKSATRCRACRPKRPGTVRRRT